MDASVGHTAQTHRIMTLRRVPGIALACTGRPCGDRDAGEKAFIYEYSPPLERVDLI
jgi:hypothetical protein